MQSVYALIYAIFITSALCYLLITWSNVHLSATIVTAFWPTQVSTVTIAINIPSQKMKVLVIVYVATMGMRLHTLYSDLILIPRFFTTIRQKNACVEKIGEPTIGLGMRLDTTT